MSHDNLNVASSWILFILFARHTSHDGVKLVEVECCNQFLKKFKIFFIDHCTSHLAELDPPDGVAEGVQGWGPERHTHHVGDHQ